MDQQFANLMEGVEAKHQELLAMQPITASDVRPKGTPIGGVYLFSEGDAAHLYAGRTKRPIGERIRNQFGANPDAASFPWLIARQETGKKAAYINNGVVGRGIGAQDGRHESVRTGECDPTGTARLGYGVGWPGRDSR